MSVVVYDVFDAVFVIFGVFSVTDFVVLILFGAGIPLFVVLLVDIVIFFESGSIG